MATNCFSSDKTILFFLFISPFFISNAFAAEPYELVNKVCNQQGNVNFCMEVLKSDESSKFATEVKTLATIAVNVAIKKSTGTRSQFQGVKDGPPGLLKSLQECIASYDTVIAEFKVCMKEEECNLTGMDIHDAGDEVKRCQSIADGNGAHDSIITPANNLTLEFVSLGETLANLMCN